MTHKLGCSPQFEKYCLRVHLVSYPAYLWIKRCSREGLCHITVEFRATPRMRLQGLGLLICCFQPTDITAEAHPASYSHREEGKEGGKEGGCVCCIPSTLGFAIPTEESPPAGFSIWKYNFYISAWLINWLLISAGLWKVSLWNPARGPSLMMSVTWVQTAKVA